MMTTRIEASSVSEAYPLRPLCKGKIDAKPFSNDYSNLLYNSKI